MFLKSALVVATLIVAELAFYIFAAGRFNPLVVTLVSLGLSVIGLWFLAKQAPGLIVRTVQDVADGINQHVAERFGTGTSTDTTESAGVDESLIADRAVKVVAAGLLAFPGLITGIAGLLLFVGPVRGVVASSLGMRLASLVPAGALGGRSSVRHSVDGVVDVTSTLKDPAPTSSSAHRGGARAQTRAPVPELP